MSRETLRKSAMQTERAGFKTAGELLNLVQAGSLVGLGEDELLGRFVEGKDARAFEVLIERHGPMVLTVCRHLLADPNDVEDAFQATFLLLIRKGSTIKRRGSLAAWLHGVACFPGHLPPLDTQGVHDPAAGQPGSVVARRCSPNRGAAEAVASDHPADDRPGRATASLPGSGSRTDPPSPP
jgi:hypothetical protein